MTAHGEITNFIERDTYIELNARQRAFSLLDPGSARELAGPFDRMESPWLALQNTTAQADDGCVVVKGTIGGQSTVVVALEGAFQGGSIGEVSGAKFATALQLAALDREQGITTHAVLILETGGVRLQEANLGLAAVAEIMSAVLELRRHSVVVTLIPGPFGCFGGMSLVAALSSYILMTRTGRLGMNGPEVIEREAGTEEFDPTDCELIWAINGGTQRFAMGIADALLPDDVQAIRASVDSFIAKGPPAAFRSAEIDLNRRRIDSLNTAQQWEPEEFRDTWIALEQGEQVR